LPCVGGDVNDYSNYAVEIMYLYILLITSPQINKFLTNSHKYNRKIASVKDGIKRKNLPILT